MKTMWTAFAEELVSCVSAPPCGQSVRNLQGHEAAPDVRKQAEDAAAPTGAQNAAQQAPSSTVAGTTSTTELLMKLRVEWVKVLPFSASTSCSHNQHGALDEYKEEAHTHNYWNRSSEKSWSYLEFHVFMFKTQLF